MSTKKERLDIRLPADEKKELIEYCDRTGQTISKVLRQQIKQLTEQYY